MNLFLGIDLGTTGIKTVLVDETARVLAQAYRGYEIIRAAPDGEEQDPQVWLQALYDCLAELGAYEMNIAAIGFSGQMHGLVALDGKGVPAGNAIIWSDRRSVAQAGEINRWLDKNKNGVCNTVSSGFLSASLLFLKQNDFNKYSKIAKIMLPKDYIRFALTGEWCTDFCDASSTGFFDIKNGCWQTELLSYFGLDASLFPEVRGAASFAGYTGYRHSCAASVPDFSKVLPAGIPVCAGSGDHAMQLIGSGIFDTPVFSCNMGTALQLSINIPVPFDGLRGTMNLFCHAVPDMYNLVGASLNGGSCIKWLTGKLFPGMSYETIGKMLEEIPPGSEGLSFIPYLNGERSPVCDPHASGSFNGLKIIHDQRHFVRSVFEGLAFNARLIQTQLQKAGFDSSGVIVAGGAFKSGFVRRLFADVLQRELYISFLPEQAASGAALLAAAGLGFMRMEEIGKTLSAPAQAAIPDKSSSMQYEGPYMSFCSAVSRVACEQ